MKRPRLKIALMVVLLLGGTAIWAAAEVGRWHRRATETFRRHAEDLRLREINVAQTFQTSASVDPEQEGDAWASYAPVLQAFRNFTGAWSWPTPAPEEHERLLARCAPLLEGLRQALSKNHIRFPSGADPKARKERQLLGAIHETYGILSRVAAGFHARGRDAEGLEVLLLVAGMSSDLKRAPVDGLWPMIWCQQVEQRMLDQWRLILAGHSLSSPEAAASIARVRRLRSVRSPLHEAAFRHGTLWRQNLLDWEREGMRQFPSGENPSWRYAFSARLGRASALNAMKRVWTRLEVLEDLPSHLWILTLIAVQEDGLPTAISHILDIVRTAYQLEVDLLRSWILLDVAMAIAQFESDRGELPETLEDLVPIYLDAVPPCPHANEPFEYNVGTVWCLVRTSHVWKVGRRW